MILRPFVPKSGAAYDARPAIIDAPVGDGHVVMFAINPIWRHQTWGQFGLFLNAILHYDALDVGRDAPESAAQEEATQEVGAR